IGNAAIAQVVAQLPQLRDQIVIVHCEFRKLNNGPHCLGPQKKKLPRVIYTKSFRLHQGGK
ncbi:hypothetical protein OFC41_26665, partial [Escherichia coli]|nr:hypothetical protein [Escherichia coli]